jgi:16S rRNA (guanine(966)-N(2))-methyltransferase RsmD
MFDMLDALGADYARVLDLYAGTGALGIEALSRGQGTADFIETDNAALRAIDENLEITGMSERGRVHRLSAHRAAEADLAGPYTLVLADPPYYDEDAFAAVRQIAGTALVSEETVIAVEHHRKQVAPEALKAFPLYRSRRHGDSVVSIYAKEDA